MLDLQHNTNSEQFEPMTWRLAEGPPPERVLTALISCDKGHWCSLTNHTIAADGTVTPSLVCPTEDCGWHVFLRLVDWRESE